MLPGTRAGFDATEFRGVLAQTPQELNEALRVKGLAEPEGFEPSIRL